MRGYFAAIAHALVHYDKKITTYSYKNLYESMAQLTQEEWIAPELSQLLMKAGELCRQKTD